MTPEASLVLLTALSPSNVLYQKLQANAFFHVVTIALNVNRMVRQLLFSLGHTRLA